MVYLKHKETSGRLPTSSYELFDNNTVVGTIQIRHQVSCGSGVPQNMASHIYYEIFSEHRSKGYGTQILKLGLKEAKDIGLNEVFVTYMKDNAGSLTKDL